MGKKNKSLKTLLILFSGLLLLSTCKKEIKVTSNVNEFGTSYYSGSFLDLRGAVPTDDNSYLLFGTTNAKNGRKDGFIMKVDENFNIIWNKTYGGDKDDYFKHIALDENGNIMAVGLTYSFGVSVDTANLKSNSLFYIVYISKDGNIIWEKSMRANEGISNINIYNSAEKVLYLKNNTFCVAGSTENFINTIGGDTNYTRDGFAFGIDKQANIKWRKQFFDTKVIEKDTIYRIERRYDENCYGAVLSSDGNVILLMSHFYYPYTNLNLIKITADDAGFSSNKFLWKSPDITEVTSAFDLKENTPLPMEILNGDKFLFADSTGGTAEVSLFDNNGVFIKSLALKKPFYYSCISKKSNQIIVSGESGPANEGGWAVLDLDGNIVKEVYTKSFDPVYDGIEFYYKNVFLTDKNQFLTFGINRKSIIMLRYDYEGNLIKK